MNSTALTMNDNAVLVTVLIPCLNEESGVEDCLRSVCDDFVRRFGEVFVIDGGSTDATVRIVKDLQQEFPCVQLLHNRDRLQAYALNLGISQARGRMLVRIDAHSRYPAGYVERCCRLLEETGAQNVGGVMAPEGRRLFSRAVATAMQHPLGVGDARFHLGGFSGPVDTVYLGAFRKTTLERLGGFDPAAHPNEDAELNIRIRQTGGTVYLDSHLVVRYDPRDSFKGLARQFYNYGRGRAYTTWKHRALTSPRQAAPVVLVVLLGASLIAWPMTNLVLIVPIGYTGLLLGTSLASPGVGGWRKRWLLPVVFLVMHVSWGVGFTLRFIQLILVSRSAKRRVTSPST